MDCISGIFCCYPPNISKFNCSFLTQDKELTTLQKEYYKAKLEEIKQDKQINETQQKEIDKLKATC